MKEQPKNLSLWQTALCLLLCLAVITVTDLALPRGEAAVYNSVIRLHIIANSNTPFDQQLKLAVRDAILAAGCFDTAADMENAAAGISYGAKKALSAANRVLEESGVICRCGKKGNSILYRICSAADEFFCGDY